MRPKRRGWGQREREQEDEDGGGKEDGGKEEQRETIGKTGPQSRNYYC